MARRARILDRLSEDLDALWTCTLEFNRHLLRVTEYFERADIYRVAPSYPVPAGWTAITRGAHGCSFCFHVPVQEWGSIRGGIESAYRAWWTRIGSAAELGRFLRLQRARFAPNLSDEWFRELLADLRQLLELRDPQVFGSGTFFWEHECMPLPEAADRLLDSLDRRRAELSDLPQPVFGTRAQPELVLSLLSERQSWALTDLPAEIGPKGLCPLSRSGFAVVRCWTRWNPPSPSVLVWEDRISGGWHLPCTGTTDECAWDSLFLEICPSECHPPEVAITVEGMAELARLRSPAREQSAPAGPKVAVTVGEDALMTASDLASAFNVPPEALRKRLDRWREKNALSNGWIENTEAAAREPRYLYKVAAVRHLIDA